MKRITKKFKTGNSLFGRYTEPGQKITKNNIADLPPGSVINNDDESGSERIVRLHNNVWLWYANGSWCYDNVERMKTFLSKKAVLCHLGE